MAQLIDTHCHVNLYESVAPLINEIANDNMEVVMVTTEPVAFETHGVNHPNIRPALGLLPHDINRLGQEVDRFLELLPSTRYVGEIGLDYLTEDAGERRLQREVFEKILSACAEAGDKVISIHSRRASDDVVSMLGSNFPGKAILHWFSGSVKNVEDAEGVYFSINPAMIRSRSGKKLIRAMNPAYLLTETDGPYVQVDDRDARPRDVKRVINWLAQEWGTNFDAAAERISKNWRR